ncbi:MAG: hypothetical protein Q4C84_11920, partial [Bacillota bacterium]|nr:hypothetical protein [Bacillota bacterium]
MNNIVTAKFADDRDVSVYGVSQWDYGQVLRIEGLKLPKMVEIHFSLEEKAGEALTRIGVTKDGVTDVVIPDSMLENEGAVSNYQVYAWVYLTDADSGSTEYKITIYVKARSKPEVPGGGDNPDAFHEAVLEVRKSAERAEEAQKQAEGYAHGREDLPERAEDNAKYYSGKAAENAEKTAEDRKTVERVAESVKDITEQVDKVEKLSKDAQEAATQAGTYAGQAGEYKQAAETASGAAQTAAEKTEADKTSVEKVKTDVENLSAQVQKNKESVDKTTQDFALTAQQALADVNNAGQTQTERVQTAGTTAVESVKTAQSTATKAVETAKTEAIKAVQTEGNKQVKAVEDKGKEVIESIPEDFPTQMQTKLDKNQGAENAGKALVVGEDGNVVPGKPQTEGAGDAADAIVNTATGNLLLIKDSAERKNKGFVMSGKTEQIQTTGKNLLNIPDIDMNTPETAIECNISKDICISVQKKATVSKSIWRFLADYKDGTKKYINDSFTTNTFSATTENPIVRIQYRGQYITEGAYTGIMVEYGTTATEYEPYTGGKLSPSAEYPQDIISAGKKNKDTGKYENKVYVNCRNLFDMKPLLNENGKMDSFFTASTEITPFKVTEGRKYVI